MNASYLRVKNWAHYQHYAKRRPPWLKLYNDLLEDDSFADLGEFEQWQLIRVWMVASRSSRVTFDGDGRIVPVVAYDERTLRRAIKSLRKVPVDLFVRDGWLIVVAESELLDPETAALLQADRAVLMLARSKRAASNGASADASALLVLENQRTIES